MDRAVALHVEDLTVAFPAEPSDVYAARRVTFGVRTGRTLGIVGESGSGKSMTLRALCGLVPEPGRVVGGAIELGGRLRTPAELVAARGEEIAMIFQDPSAALNPVLTVGGHLEEVLRIKRGMRSREARAHAAQLLDHVGIPQAASRLRAYPHELSGGMRQRVMIALALAARPRVLLADEPTTALDVTTQRQILELLLQLQDETGMAIVIVTHDLGVVADVCDDVAVMYAGYVVERGTCEQVLSDPRHPYTRALLDAMPRLEADELPSGIPGQPPDLADLPPGCPFAPRCRHSRPACADVDMTIDPSTHCACPFSTRLDPAAGAVSACQ